MVTRWTADLLLHAPLGLPEVDLQSGRPKLPFRVGDPEGFPPRLLQPLLDEWLVHLKGTAMPPPERILVVDEGGGFAFAIQEQFPEAEIVAYSPPGRDKHPLLKAHRD